MQSSNYYQPTSQQKYMMQPPNIMDNGSIHTGGGEEDDSDENVPDKRSGRRKIKIEYISDKSRRHITFSKRKAGIMKKAYELSTLTGTQVLLLVVSETGLVYTFTTPKLQPLVTKPEGKNLIQSCLNAPDPIEAASMHPQDGRFSANSATTSPPMANNTNYYRSNQDLSSTSNNNYMDDRKSYGNIVATNPSLVLNNTAESQISASYNPMAYSGYGSTSVNTNSSTQFPYNLQAHPDNNDGRYWGNNNSINNESSNSKAVSSKRQNSSKR